MYPTDNWVSFTLDLPVKPYLARKVNGIILQLALWCLATS